MNWYYYLNYKIYKYYKSKRDSTPVFYAFAVTVTLACLNLLTIIFAYSFIDQSIKKQINRVLGIYTMVALALVNYLLLYRNKKYEDVFNDFAISSFDYKSWDLSVKIYIGVSIALCLIVLIIADMINQGKIAV